MNTKESKCCDECFDEGVSQLSYGGCKKATCPCHAAPMNTIEEKPYNQEDHYHCWQSKKPPCGQKIQHLLCCLCELPNPKVFSFSKEKGDKAPSPDINVGGFDYIRTDTVNGLIKKALTTHTMSIVESLERQKEPYQKGMGQVELKYQQEFNTGISVAQDLLKKSL